MASVATVRADMVTALTGIPALNSAFPDGYRVSAYPLSNPTPPQIEIAEFEIQKHQAMADGAEWWTWTIRAYVAQTTDVLSLATADAFLDNDPITAALEADATLKTYDLIVDRVRQGYWPGKQTAPLAGVEYSGRLLI